MKFYLEILFPLLICSSFLPRLKCQDDEEQSEPTEICDSASSLFKNITNLVGELGVVPTDCTEELDNLRKIVLQVRQRIRQETIFKIEESLRNLFSRLTNSEARKEQSAQARIRSRLCGPYQVATFFFNNALGISVALENCPKELEEISRNVKDRLRRAQEARENSGPISSSRQIAYSRAITALGDLNQQIDEVFESRTTLVPPAEATEPATEATEPTTEATEPTTEATEPTTEATEPTTEATKPTTEATTTEARTPSTTGMMAMSMNVD